MKDGVAMIEASLQRERNLCVGSVAASLMSGVLLT